MAQVNDFSGVWRSDAHFSSKTRGGEYAEIHYVKMHLKGTQLVIESLHDDDDAYLLARFSLDGGIATGSWQNQMSQHGHYKGMLYQGAAQLVLSSDGNSFKGKWVGYGRSGDIKTGDWEFVRAADGEVPTKRASEKEINSKG